MDCLRPLWPSWVLLVEVVASEIPPQTTLAAPAAAPTSFTQRLGQGAAAEEGLQWQAIVPISIC